MNICINEPVCVTGMNTLALAKLNKKKSQNQPPQKNTREGRKQRGKVEYCIQTEGIGTNICTVVSLWDVYDKIILFSSLTLIALHKL